MKALLTLAFLAALGVSVYLERVKIPQIKAENTAEIHDLNRQLAEKKSEVVALKKQSAEFERLLAEAEKKAPEPEPVKAPEPVVAAQAPAIVEHPAKDVSAILAGFKAQYDQKKAVLDSKMSALQRNEQYTAANLESLKSSPPIFKEQVRDQSGKVSGIRTSDSDRKIATDAYNAKVSQAEAYLASIRKAILDLQADYGTLEKNYSEAVSNATR